MQRTKENYQKHEREKTNDGNVCFQNEADVHEVQCRERKKLLETNEKQWKVCFQNQADECDVLHFVSNLVICIVSQ